MKCRQNWSEACETQLNNQINSEYEASLAYHCLANYFNRDDVGLKKLYEYFSKASLEEIEHADKLMEYQNMRGGIVKLTNIQVNDYCLEKPNDILESFNIALELEKSINQKLIDLHRVAEDSNDAQFSDYIEGNFLNEQVEAISEISKIISVLDRFQGDQHAIWNFINTSNRI